jgi:hypothetical protein
MVKRGLQLVLTVLLLVSSGGCVAVDRDSDSTARVETATAARSSARCTGLERRDVRGAEPTYSRKSLSTFRNHASLCHGIWLPHPRRHLVPQGLAITGNTAWLSGFRYRKGFGKRPCQLVRVDLVTGRRLQHHSAIYGSVGKRPRTYCRHGGGILQRGPWLWVVEKSKLWLVDPSRKGDVLDARRAWHIDAPVRGSAIVATRSRIGVVPYQVGGTPRIYWYDLGSVLRRGVLDLAVRSSGRSQIGAVASTRIPRYTQGATLDSRGRLYLTRSNLSCGELVTPFGRRKAFIPGAEGIQFAAGDRRLWTVSESGSRPYSLLGKPLTPAVASFEWPRLLAGRRPSCGFSAY